MDDNTDGEKRTDIWMQLCKFFLNFPKKKKKKKLFTLYYIFIQISGLYFYHISHTKTNLIALDWKREVFFFWKTLQQGFGCILINTIT